MTIVANPFLPGFRLVKGEDLSALTNQLASVNKQIVSAGISPAATGADNVMAVFSVPANSFSAANNALYIQAQGKFASNGNTKEVKIIFNATTAVVGSTVTGGTAIADSGAVTTNGGGWSLQASVLKYGVAGSNTQLAVHEQAQLGGAVAALLAPSLVTANEGAAILIAVTGNCTTTATDIVLNYVEIDGSN